MPGHERTPMTDDSTARNAALDELVATAPKLTADDLDRLRRLLNPTRKHTITRKELELAA